MRYFSLHNGDHKLVGIGTGIGGVEITEEEYNCLLTEILKKAELVDKLYSGEITIDDVLEDWRDEVQHRVDERIATEGEAADRYKQVETELEDLKNQNENNESEEE